MTDIPSILLLPHHVPAPPADGDVRADWVRWLVIVMNAHDAHIWFIAWLLQDPVKHGSPTAYQAPTAQFIRRAQVSYYLAALHSPRRRLSPHKAIGFRPLLVGDNTEKGA